MVAMNENKVFSKRMKMLRQDMQLSQVDLAKKMTDVRGCTITQALVSKWETGVHVPELPNLVALAKIYDVAPEYLLGESDKPGEYGSYESDDDGNSRRKLRDDEKVLLDTYRSLSDKDKKFIARALELIRRDNP